jgi:SAM-dependent methyltransferase
MLAVYLGEAMSAAGFFDRYPRFLSTSGSETQAGTGRLNLRYAAIVETNLETIRDRRILDIASHDGRWSFAALMAGASHVTGIEANRGLVTSAVETMEEYEISPDRYRFIAGDAHEAINELTPEDFDTIFCFGFLYHTVHHMRLFSSIARLRPQDLIIDTGVCLDKDAVVRLVEEDSGGFANAAKSDYETSAWVLVGWPSIAALEMMLEHIGYGQIEYYNWQGHDLAGLPEMLNYCDGRRITLRARKSAAGTFTPRVPITRTPDWVK